MENHFVSVRDLKDVAGLTARSNETPVVI